MWLTGQDIHMFLLLLTRRRQTHSVRHPTCSNTSYTKVVRLSKGPCFVTLEETKTTHGFFQTWGDTSTPIVRTTKMHVFVSFWSIFLSREMQSPGFLLNFLQNTPKWFKSVLSPHSMILGSPLILLWMEGMELVPCPFGRHAVPFLLLFQPSFLL